MSKLCYFPLRGCANPLIIPSNLKANHPKPIKFTSHTRTSTFPGNSISPNPTVSYSPWGYPFVPFSTVYPEPPKFPPTTRTRPLCRPCSGLRCSFSSICRSRPIGQNFSNVSDFSNISLLCMKIPLTFLRHTNCVILNLNFSGMGKAVI